MATKKKSASDEMSDSFAQRFPMTLGPADRPDDDWEGGEKKAKPQTDDGQTALLERLARIEGQLQERDRTINALMSKPIVPLNNELAKPQPKALPDPVADPEAYASVVRDNLLAEMKFERDQERAQNNDQNTVNNRAAALFKQFSDKYPDLAKHADAVESAAMAANRAAAAQGLDINSYMFDNPTRYIEEVKSKLDSWGIGAKAAEEEGEEEPDNRTIGIPGGLESRGHVQGAAEDRGPEKLFAGVTDWQRKTGFQR